MVKNLKTKIHKKSMTYYTKFAKKTETNYVCLCMHASNAYTYPL